jgi:hypothetical protein
VKGDDLVAEDVGARGNAGRNGGHPGEAILNQLISDPATRSLGAVKEATLVDLEELKGGLLDGAAVTVAAGKVVDDGADVRLGPGVPGDGDGVTSSNSGRVHSIGSTTVADNIRVLEGVGKDKAIVLDGGSPTDRVGRRVTRLEARDDLAVDGDLGDVTVGGDESRGSRKGGEKDRSLGLGERHIVGLREVARVDK